MQRDRRGKILGSEDSIRKIRKCVAIGKEIQRRKRRRRVYEWRNTQTASKALKTLMRGGQS